MRHLFFIFSFVVFSSALISQNISFSFTANHVCKYVQSDSIFIENLTQGGDTTLYWNDTVITFIFTGFDLTGNNESGFFVSQNYPNPFETSTSVDVYIPDHGDISLIVYDLTGKELIRHKSVVGSGLHSYDFFAGNSGTYILAVVSGQDLKHIIMIQLGKGLSENPSLRYKGFSEFDDYANQIYQTKSLRSIFEYSPGDELRFTVFVSGDFLQMTDNAEESEDYFFDIAANIPETPEEITGSADICENSENLTYEVGFQNNAIYEWILPNGWTFNGSEDTNIINVNSSTESGEIRVKAYNNCGESAQQTLSVLAHERPIIDSPNDAYACDLYILPEQSNGSYFAESGGVDPITDYEITESQTVFIYAENLDYPNCYTETSFEVVIYETPEVNLVETVSSCDSYELPVLSVGNYFSTPGGINPISNLLITESQTIYIYAETGTEPNCYDESSFEIIIHETPAIDTYENVSACDLYTLPELTNGEYFAESGGVNPISNLDITETQTIYIYAESPNAEACFAENSFVVTIYQTPVAESMTDVVVCDSYTLPALSEGAYFFESGGINPVINDELTESQTIFIYAETGTDPNCYDETNFNISINTAPEMPIEQTPTIGVNEIVWNWSISSAASGYRINTEDDFDSAIDLGTETTYTSDFLICDTDYAVYIWSYNDCGYSDVLILEAKTEIGSFTTCGDCFTDSRDNNVYNTVQIGNQCWLASNLKFLPSVTGPNSDWNSTEFRYAVYGYTSSDNSVEQAKLNPNYEIFGVLYNWYAAMAGSASSNENPSGVQGICPAQWHIPSDNEWKHMEIYLGMSPAETDGTNWRGTDEGGKLKNVEGWNSPNTGATNSSGFSALSGGYRSFMGGFSASGSSGYWWTSTENGVMAWYRLLRNDYAQVFRNSNWKEEGMYVRCLMDCPPPAAPVEGTHVPGNENILWNWESSDGADGYRYNTVNNYATATDNGNNTEFNQIGLDICTNYTMYVWAYGSCGVSPVRVLTATTIGSAPAIPGEGTHNAGENQIVWNWTSVAGAEGYKYSTINDYVSASDNGSNISYTQEGLEICTEYNLYVWAYNNCGVSDVVNLTETSSGSIPSTPVAATHIPTNNSIEWNWQNQADADGFKYNTVNDYSSAVDIGSVTGFIQTELEICSSYDLFVWAYNICGVSDDLTMNASTSGTVPEAPMAGTHIPDAGEIHWNWQLQSDADGYKYNTVNDYASATDNGLSTDYMQEGLANCAEYYLYVWTYNNCGHSVVSEFTETSGGDTPTAPVSGVHIAELFEIEWNWQEVADAAGYKYNTEDSYAGAIDNGNSTSFTQDELNCNSDYVLYVWAYNDCGESASTMLEQSTENPAASFNCGDLFTDCRDGKQYSTVQIEDQCWMAENLRYLPSVNGPGIGSDTQPHYYVYSYQFTDTETAMASTNYGIYGVLYNWTAALTACPEGWDLPSDDDWTELSDFLGGGPVAGGKLKETGTEHWNEPNTGATDEYGFTALPGGQRSSTGFFTNYRSYGYWWSANQEAETNAWGRMMYYDSTNLGRDNYVKRLGLSVRCVK